MDDGGLKFELDPVVWRRLAEYYNSPPDIFGQMRARANNLRATLKDVHAMEVELAMLERLLDYKNELDREECLK